jgi:hypothetical protein
MMFPLFAEALGMRIVETRGKHSNDLDQSQWRQHRTSTATTAVVHDKNALQLAFV